MKAKHIILTVLIGALIFSVAPVHARLFGNSSDSAYDGGDGTSSAERANPAGLSIGELYAGKVPGNAHMWNLNQVCAKVHMFGQYVARIFKAIK
jgi:hypothetical protein